MEAEKRADPGRSAAFRWHRWFANPLTRLGLRTPIIRRLLGRSLVLLTVRGSRTGSDFTFPVMYARDGDDIVVVPGRPETKTWWRNLRDPAEVRVRLAGRELEAKARAIEGVEAPGAVAEGLEPWLLRFPRAARAMNVEAGDGFDREEFARLAARSVLVRIEGAASAGT